MTRLFKCFHLKGLKNKSKVYNIYEKLLFPIYTVIDT